MTINQAHIEERDRMNERGDGERNESGRGLQVRFRIELLFIDFLRSFFFTQKFYLLLISFLPDVSPQKAKATREFFFYLVTPHQYCVVSAPGFIGSMPLRSICLNTTILGAHSIWPNCNINVYLFCSAISFWFWLGRRSLFPLLLPLPYFFFFFCLLRKKYVYTTQLEHYIVRCISNIVVGDVRVASRVDGRRWWNGGAKTAAKLLLPRSAKRAHLKATAIILENCLPPNWKTAGGHLAASLRTSTSPKHGWST